MATGIQGSNVRTAEGAAEQPPNTYQRLNGKGPGKGPEPSAGQPSQLSIAISSSVGDSQLLEAARLSDFGTQQGDNSDYPLRAFAPPVAPNGGLTPTFFTESLQAAVAGLHRGMAESKAEINEGVRQLGIGLRAELSDHIAAFERFTAEFKEELLDMEKRFEVAQDELLAKVASNKTDADLQHASANERLEALEANVAALQKALLVAAKSVPVAPPRAAGASNDFERDIDVTILVFRGKPLLPKENMLAGITPFIDECGFTAEDYTVESSDLSRRLVIRFKGLALVASRKVQQCLRRIKRSDGTFHDFEAKSVDGSIHSLYISEDKNQQQIRIEMDGRRLQKIIKAARPGLPVFRDRAAGVLTSDWVPFARVVANSANGPTTIEWDEEAVEKFEIDTADAQEKFRGDSKVSTRKAPVWKTL